MKTTPAWYQQRQHRNLTSPTQSTQPIEHRTGVWHKTRRRRGHPMCENPVCSPRYRQHAEMSSLLTRA